MKGLDGLEELAQRETYPCYPPKAIKDLIALCKLQHETLIKNLYIFSNQSQYKNCLIQYDELQNMEMKV